MPLSRRALLGALASHRGLRGALGGTFLQLNSVHLDWTRQRWTALFGYFRHLGLQRVVVQWTADEDLSFVPILDRIFAESSGVRVKLGLRNEFAFWIRNPGNRAAAFAGIYERTLPLIVELAPYSRRPGFDGFYIPQEFDDVNWSRRDARAAGGDYLRGIARALRRQVPGARISVSAFANGKMPPPEYARLWRGVVRHARLDEVLFQDGVGVGKLTIEQAAAYLRALRAELGERSGAVVETFTQVREEPFEARPAEASRIRRQLESAAACGFPAPVAFSVPEYMTPLGGEEAAKLFAEFQATRAR
jgi:hypothetical protein